MQQSFQDLHLYQIFREMVSDYAWMCLKEGNEYWQMKQQNRNERKPLKICC
ncbi:hypothetical protein [Calothrix sp. UHCC 0171]|uniref:hypothetical protein n=1 Tax=Calothrix sp. UHCC 0171 TaxID=3110245 RepID=UPI002B205032|nr:hypothetical protein [Calothrix sp. UHCC 0171]MEA5574149.1 hypothetical protein [Calothrix sp. UHCC 0171]